MKKQWIWIWASLLVWVLSTGHVLSAPAQGKVVAVVYDNSGSMAEVDNRSDQPRNRWVYANYATKFLAASLRKEDELIFVPLHDLTKPTNEEGAVNVYQGNTGLDRAILALDAQRRAGGGTPYGAISKAVARLKERARQGRSLWLVVITDGEFEGASAMPSKDAEWLRANSVDVRFVLIGSKSNQIASELTGGVASHILAGGEGKTVTKTVAKLAEALNGFSNLTLEGSGREVLINAPFPLRRVMVLRQDSVSAELGQVMWGEKSLDLGSLRKPKIITMTDERLPALDLPSSARVYQIENDNEVLPANKPLKLVFGSEVERSKLEVLPEVAAHYFMKLLDADKRPLPKGADGKYLVCGKRYYLEGLLQDDAGNTLLASRSDVNNFKIETKVGGKDMTFGPGAFVQVVDAGPWRTEAEVNSTMTYPGYLYRQSEPMTLVFGGDACQKKVTLKVTSGVDDGGVWRSPVNQAGQAQPVRLAVQVDGKPATVDQLASWQLETGASASVLEVTPEAGGFLLRPRSDCCVWWWRNPGPGEYPSTLVLKTNNTRDVINGSPSVKFILEPPRSLLDKVFWYGCPFALSVLILAIVWYVMRLLRKARFGEDSRLETEERPKDDYGGVIRPSTVVLREECSAVKRWLWPSRAEVAVIRGLRLIAEAQGEVRVDGRDLEPKHKVPGWVFDRARVDAPSARERRQDDAGISDNVVLKIDEGTSEVWMRYRA